MRTGNLRKDRQRGYLCVTVGGLQKKFATGRTVPQKGSGRKKPGGKVQAMNRGDITKEGLNHT